MRSHATHLTSRCDRRFRIEDTIRKLENQREDKLRKWQEGLHDVNPWITKTLDNIKPEPTLANDVDSAYDQIDEFQVIRSLLSKYILWLY